jgi:integrase
MSFGVPSLRPARFSRRHSVEQLGPDTARKASPSTSVSDKLAHPFGRSFSESETQPAKLLHNAAEHDSELLSLVAIQLFAALRRSEICALEWSEVDIVEKHLEGKHYGYLDLESPTNA